MFEKDIKFIADFSLNKIKMLGSFFTFQKLQSVDLHPAILQYISAELDFLIYEDRKKLLHQSVFDYSGPEIAKYFNQIAQEIKKTKRIAFEDLKKLIIQAVSFNANFTVRPKWSLVKLIFDGQDTKQVDEIRLMLNSLYYYEHLKNILIEYLTRKNVVLLNATEFEIILNKLDKNLFSSQAQTLVDNALYSISDFFDVGAAHKGKISASSVEIFLKEKNLMEYLFRLRRYLPGDPKMKFDVEEIQKILYSPPRDKKDKIIEKEVVPEVNEVLDEDLADLKFNDDEDEQLILDDDFIKNQFSDDDFEEEKEESELSLETEDKPELSEELDEVEEDQTEVENKIPVDEELLSPVDVKTDMQKEDPDTIENEPENEEEIKSVDTGDLDSLYDFEEEFDTSEILKELEDESEELEKLIEKDQETLDSIPTDFEFDVEKDEIHKKEIPDEIEDELEIADEEIEKQNIQKEKLKKKFEKDLFSYLSNKEIDKIVSTVFNEDREDFANTMEKVTECNSYDEATDILKSVFLTYRVNPYLRDAVTLTNAVSNYFDQV